MVFNGESIVKVKGPTLAERLASRLKQRDTTNGPAEYKTPRQAAISRRTLAKTKDVPPDPDSVPTIQNLANNE